MPTSSVPMSERVLILAQCFPPAIGGIENLMGGLARALSDDGAMVTVFADAHPKADDTNMSFEIRRFGGIKFLRRRRKAVAGREAATRHGVSRIFCDSWKSLEHLSPPPTVPVTVFAHGTEYPLSPSRRKRQRIASALARADRILAVSAATRERMRSCAIDTERVKVWHPAIDEPPLVSCRDRAQAAELWRQAEHRLFTVARLTKRKGVDTAIRAVAALAATYPKLRYLIAGDGPEARELHDLVIRLDLRENVELIGVVSSSLLCALYDSGDVFVLPSHPVGRDVEGFGLVFLEAGYFGLPVVAGRGGGASEAVDNGVTGLLCDGTDRESVRQVLASLLANESLRRRFGDNARSRTRGALWPARVKELLDFDSS